MVRLVLASRYFTKNGASSARKRPRTTALRWLAGSALCAERQAAAAGITRNAIATSSTSNEAALVSNHKLNSLCSPLHQRSDLASAARLLGFRLATGGAKVLPKVLLFKGTTFGSTGV